MPLRNGTHTRKRQPFAEKHACKLTFPTVHRFHVHSITASYDNDHFLTGDEVSVRLWDVNSPQQCYEVVNIEPPKIEDLLEVITHCEYHPTDSSAFLYSSSKGYVQLCDLRQSSSPGSITLSPKEEEETPPFSEITKSVSWASFSPHDDHTIASRDYLGVKLWDRRKPDHPYASYPLQSFNEKELQTLYDGDHLFDRFDLHWSRQSTSLSTGAYDDNFTILDLGST